MKNVLHIFYSGLGGHGNVFFSLLKADKFHKYQTSVLLYGIENPREEYTNRFKKLKIKNSYVKKIQGLDIKFWFRVYKKIVASKPDIVFLHGSYNALPAIFYRIFNWKTKIIIRETQANHLKTNIQWVLLSFCLLFSDKIVFLSTEYRAEIKKRLWLFYQKKRIEVIPNGIDLDFFKPQINTISNGSVIKIGMVSRVVPIKDHETLIKAFAQLGIKDVQLEIAGDGTTLKELKELAKKLGMSEKITFHGMLNESDLPDFFQSLDIYVHATYGETMSTAIMQAQACALPIIASNVDGVKNIIIHNDTGLLVELKDVEDLKKQLLLLINDEQLRIKFSQSSINYAYDRLSMNRMFHSYEQIF